MRFGLLAGAALSFATFTLGACGDDDTDTTTDTAKADSTADTTVDVTPDTTVAETVQEVAQEVAEETTPDTASTTVTWNDVFPIFSTSCTPCHAGTTEGGGGGPSGGHSIGSPDKHIGYEASQRDAHIQKCAGLKIGQCALLRIKDGSMPANGACRDPKTAQCPDADEQALIQQWIDDGMLEQ